MTAPAKYPEIEALREVLSRGIFGMESVEQAIDAAERRIDELVRERDEAERRVEEVLWLKSGEKYERAYLAALTGMLASGECQSFNSASNDANTFANLALAAFEARAKGSP